MTTPRGIRNNNPGNIVQSGIAWRGKLAQPTDDRFEQFDTAENGIRALAKLLLSYQDKHGLRTPRGIINRWAPPSENDSLAYAKVFGDALGVGIDETVDLHRTTTLIAATLAIIRHENGVQPYAADLIAAAVVDALQIDTPAPAPRPAPTPQPQPQPQPQRREERMGGILGSLLPMVLGMFSGRAQAAIGRATGADPQVAAQFTQDLFAKLGQLVNVPVTDDATAVQAVAQAQTRKAAGDDQVARDLEAHALDYLDKIAPLLDKLAMHEIAVRKAADDSADRAAARGQKDARDIAPMLAVAGIALFAVALLMVGGSLVIQMLRDTDHQVDPLLASLLTILIYAAARIAEAAYRYRFGGSAESAVVDSGNVAVRAAVEQRTGGRS